MMLRSTFREYKEIDFGAERGIRVKIKSRIHLNWLIHIIRGTNVAQINDLLFEFTPIASSARN